jgi:hypothetical protein
MATGIRSFPEAILESRMDCSGDCSSEAGRDLKSLASHFNSNTYINKAKQIQMQKQK